MGLGRIHADADHGGVEFGEVFAIVPEAASFGRTARRVVFGVKVENQPASPIVREATGDSILVLGFEVRSVASDLECAAEKFAEHISPSGHRCRDLVCRLCRAPFRRGFRCPWWKSGSFRLR